MEEHLNPLTALEACRPGSADLELPELAEAAATLHVSPVSSRQFEAVQHWDTRLAQALREGSVPAGLEERVLAILQTADEQPETVTASSPLPHRSRRRGIWTAVAVAATLAAVATGVAVWSVLNDDGELTVTSLHEQAAQWTDGLAASRWRQTPPPSSFPFDAREVLLTHNGWQKTTLPAAGEAVAYRLPPPRQGVRQMTLLVFKGSIPGLGPFAPRDPYRTQSQLVGAWQVGENVYVLVIRGDDLSVLQDVYQRSINTHRRAA